MSQSLASLSRNFISVFICLILVACNGSYTAFEDDVNFDVDRKTVDIEQDNAELKALAVFQSAFIGHFQSAAYDFLDVNDLPDNQASTIVGNEYQKNCPDLGAGTGTAMYTFSRSAGEPHKVGDRISVTYDNCSVGEKIYDGALSARYTNIKGLNDYFKDVSTNECLVGVQDKINIEQAVPQSIVYDEENDVYTLDGAQIASPGGQYFLDNKSVIFLTGDELKFKQVANHINVELISVSYIENENSQPEKIETIELTLQVSEDDKAVFVLQPSTSDDSMLTSIDGDQIYSLVSGDETRESCQSFERTLSVSFNNFSTNKPDYLYTELNGSVTLFEEQETSDRINQSFIDSNFQTIVRQGKIEETFSMKDYRVEKAVNLTNNSYAYEFEGLISNSGVLKGQLELTTFGKLLGNLVSNYPYAGTLEIKAKGLERIVMRPNNLDLRLQVDYDGDSSGNGFSDFDIDIFTTWSELFAREFKE